MSDDLPEVSDKKSPGFWFYTGDFEKDMQILPLSAQGLWIRMMCWMSENEIHRGFAELPTGEPMTELDIAHRVGKPIKEVRAGLDALRRMGTFSEDTRGCIFSRRMARDTHISEVRRQAALKRAKAVERAKDGSFAPAKPPAKPEQNPTVTVSAPVSSSVSVKSFKEQQQSAALETTGSSEPGAFSPPPELQLKNIPKANGNGKHDRAAMERQLKLHEWAKNALLTYPGAQVLHGSPDDVVIAKCLVIARGHPGFSEEQAMAAALVAMRKAGKEPAKSWMWFPSVMPQFLEKTT